MKPSSRVTPNVPPVREILHPMPTADQPQHGAVRIASVLLRTVLVLSVAVLLSFEW